MRSRVEPRRHVRPAPPRRSAALRVMQGFFEGLDIPIDRERLVIGRGQGADVVIAESTMSRRHAAFGYGELGFFVEDLGSTNGTTVNGRDQTKAQLRDGDEIRLGKLRLKIHVGS